MGTRILPASRYPVPRIPVFSGGASGELWCMEHDPAYGRLYYGPFAIADREGTSGQQKLEARGVPVHVVKKPKGMPIGEWGDRVAVEIETHMPAEYDMQDALVLLTGSNKLFLGERVERTIGPRKINVHPAPLYILTNPADGQTVDVYGRDPAEVRREYLGRGFTRRYVGWGAEIMPKILMERHAGASAAHIATPEKDHGPCIAVRHKEREARHVGHPEVFQAELKNEGDGPVIAAATHMILQRLEIEGEALVWRGQRLPYQGLELEDGWEQELGIEPMKE